MVAFYLTVSLAGGLVVALLLFRVSKRFGSPVRDVYGRHTASTDVINMAHIRVAGAGGLGLVIVALATALDIPEIGQLVTLSFMLGVVLAVGLIAWRRRKGPMPSSGGQMGANTMLSIDAPKLEDEPRTPPSVSSRIEAAASAR
jgi:hypothetical protein